MGSCVSYISDSSHIGGLITGVPWFGAATIALSVSLVVIVFNYRSAGFHDGKPIPLLVVLKKDLKLSQAENAKKDAIIQYLLNFMVRNLTLAEHDAEKDRVTKKVFKDGIEELVSSIKDAIFTLSITNVGGIRPRDESRRCSEGPNDEIVETGDLIDLLSSNDETENTKLTEEDTTLLEELYDDMSDFEAVTANTLRSSSSNSFDSGFSESSYIVRFANCDPAHDFCGGIEHAGKVISLFSDSIIELMG